MTNGSTTRRILGTLVRPDEVLYAVIPAPRRGLGAAMRAVFDSNDDPFEGDDGRQWVLVDQRETAFIARIAAARVVERLEVERWAKRPRRLLDTVHAGGHRFRLLHLI